MVRLLSDFQDRSDGVAVIDAVGDTTWGELNERSNRLIDVLRRAGVQPGDRVALLAGNRREIEEVYVACASAGIGAAAASQPRSPASADSILITY